LGKPFAFDVETSGLSYLKDRLLGVALSFQDGGSYYLVIEHTVPVNGEIVETKFIDIDKLPQILNPLFAQEDVLMVGHNAKFDLHFLTRAGVKLHGRLADTLLAAKLLDENRDNDLKSLAANILGSSYQKYQELAVYKGYKKSEILAVPLDQAAQYAMNDTEATLKLYWKFAQALANERHRGNSLADVFNNLWMPLLFVLQEMESRGIAVDMDNVKALRYRYNQEREKLRSIVVKEGLEVLVDHFKDNLESIPSLNMRMATKQEIADAYTDVNGRHVTDIEDIGVPIITHDMVGRTERWTPRVLQFKTNSIPQLQDFVYKYTKVRVDQYTPLKRAKNGQYAVDKDNLETLVFYLGNECPPFIKRVLEWRKVDKVITTYLDRFIKDCDRDDHYALHTSFNQDVARTGRLSSSGPNLQNISARGDMGAEVRSCFVARPYHQLLVGDLSQAELRMLAHYSRDPLLIDAFATGKDLHSLTAAGNMGISYEEFMAELENGNPEHAMQRRVGKTQNFGLLYGMAYKKFQRYLLTELKMEITFEEAKELINKFNATYARSTAWKREVEYAVRQVGYVATISGRKRRLPDAFSRDEYIRGRAERQGVNCIIQGSVGDIMAEGMIEVQKALRPYGAHLLLQVHDEDVAEVPTSWAEQARDAMEYAMTSKCNLYLRVPQKAEVGIGQSWYTAKG
jgi:DNA polymerase I-like protein with 3'-5' exonuclease and polymerase domains